MPTESDHDILIELKTKIGRIESDVRDIKTSMEDDYISKDKFSALESRHGRLEKVVYAIISIPLVGFLSALVYLVWKQ